VVLPPGEGDTVTLGDYLANQAQSGCDGLGPHFCDQSSLYMNWGFRNGDLLRLRQTSEARPGRRIRCRA